MTAPLRLRLARFAFVSFADERSADGPVMYPFTTRQSVGKARGRPTSPPDLTPVRVARERLAPFRFARASLVLESFAWFRSALVRLAPVSVVPERFAGARPALVRFAPVRSAYDASVLVMIESARFALVSAASK